MLTSDHSIVSTCGVMARKFVGAVLTMCVCVRGGQADESEGAYRDDAGVQLMLQLCSKDSPAVRRISPCAYVIRIHGTTARPGVSDSQNAQPDEKGESG